MSRMPRASIGLLKTAINNYSDKYNFYSGKQLQSSNDALYFIGKGYMYDGQIDSGMQYLVYYQNLLRDNLPLDAGRQLKMCVNAKQLMKKPREINVVEVGSPINTEYDESHPVISLDSKVLFFASRRPSGTKAAGGEQLNDDDIYFAMAGDDGAYGSPQPFPFNTPYDEEPVSISANGNTLYLRRANKKGKGDIYYSEKKDDKWTDPKKMKGVNSAADEQGLCISSDGTAMIVSSNRPGGYGGYDLYAATGSKTGKWSGLKNLGPAVNSEMDEVSPFIFPNSKRVYFSTNGNTEYGMGGFDIFFTEPDSGSKKWSSPFTMGYPINRSGNEMDYVVGAGGKAIYTAVGKKGDLDLFNIVAGEFKPDVQEQITEVVGTSETQTVAVVEVEKEKKVEVEKEVEVSKVQEVEKDVDKNVGFVNADDAKKLDKVIAVQKEEVEVQNIVETEKTVYTNQSQHVIDSLNAAGGSTQAAADATATVSNPADNSGNDVATNVAVNPNNARTKTDSMAAYKGKEKADAEALNMRAERVLASIGKEDRDALIKKIKDDLTKEMEEKRHAVFKSIYFTFNTDTIQLGKYELGILVDFMKEHKNVNIEVVGHTDNIGTWETNFWMSRQRAKAVYDYLVARNIATNRIIFNGKGAIEPASPNNTRAGRALNRRVEINLIQ
jgi:outer membrane protein OmpA-like peptidoglycan-associated protein